MAGVRRWTLTDIYEVGEPPYTMTFVINPNEGGSPAIEKQLSVQTNVGPIRNAMLQEGQLNPLTIEWSGVILSQVQYEALERWAFKRVMLRLVDDLGRQFVGILSHFKPNRIRKATNFWYHTYSAGFQVRTYMNASGLNVFGTPTARTGVAGLTAVAAVRSAGFVAAGGRAGMTGAGTTRTV